MLKNILKKAMYCVSLAALFSPYTAYGKSHVPKDVPGTAIFVMAPSSELQADTKAIRIQNEVLALDVKIPQLSGLENKKFQKQLNKTLLKEAKERVRSITEEANTYNKQMLEDALTPLKFEYVENFVLIHSPSPYASLAFLRYQYSGGAHGLSYQSYLTIDTHESKLLTLDALFKEDVDYKELINEEIRMQLKERTEKGEYFFTGASGFKSIKDNQAFYINTEGQLVIVFNVYEIAPYAAGVIEFPIDFQKLMPYLK